MGVVSSSRSGTRKQNVKRLAARGLKHAYIDGGVSITRFLAAGLIQRFVLTRSPVLRGSGIPLFGYLSHDIRFEHVATRAYASGLVSTEYNIAYISGQ